MALPLIHPCHGSSNDCKGELLPASNDASISSYNFECSICLELSQDPVVTMCGHLFCWSCLHRWITLRSTVQDCPVCKACIKDKIIPLYGRGKIGGFTASSRAKTALELEKPRPPPAERNYAMAADVPSYTPAYQRHGFVSHRNYINRGGRDLAYSAASFGLFPALFGVHMVNLPDYGSRFSSGSAYGASLGFPAIGDMTSQQQRLNVLQECILYWFLILLACFAVLCFLLF